MRISNVHRIVFTFLLIAVILAACAEGPAQASEAKSDLERDESPSAAPQDVQQVAAGNHAFAFDLYQALADGEGNLFFSPHSISVALAMTFAGARTTTEEEMADTLHFLLPQDQLHPAFNALDLELASREEGFEDDEAGFQLNIANTIWGQEGYEFLQEFLDTLALNYGAGLQLLDFMEDPETARIIINDWVSEQTEGRIEDLIPQGVIDAATRLVLTNAIYFKAQWMEQFEESNTVDGPFHLLDGSEVTVPLMSQEEGFPYAEGDGYQAIELPYVGGQTSMVILLPEEGRFEEFESALSVEQVAEIIGSMQFESLILTMPKFEFESDFSLSKTLAEMGMPTAFGFDADFSGMNGKRDLYISDVVHKAFVLVDEEGTEAAAATAVIVAEMGAIIPEIEMKIDRPFIFMIRDIETDSILFLGRVLNPAE
ncbi:MAG: serpin family protein [Anaerolineales bacterium]|nr:serpin family protein [Anaerolineales bacterium]